MLMVSMTRSGEFNFCSVKKLWFSLYLLGEQLVDQFYEVLDSGMEGDQCSAEAIEHDYVFSYSSIAVILRFGMVYGVYVSLDAKSYISAIG
jgi:hypothetical protein